MFYILMGLAVAILVAWDLFEMHKKNKSKDQRIAELEMSYANYMRLMQERFDKVAADRVKTNALIESLTLPPLRHDETATWKKADADAWRGIMVSELGRKFLFISQAANKRMLVAAEETMLKPTADSQISATHQVHGARGFQECLKWIQLLTVSPTVEGVSQPPTEGAQGEAQSSDQELADVLTRMSPK